ncbi:MAG: insulinase family protein [Paludibacter sp.]|jgi:predicted Zn-dependent peptidase|nr:insulinase family protein [Paludibacter sp.]
MIYHTHTLPNGLRIIVKPEKSEVVYCGAVINVGSRDELENELGMAHFVEHLLFKGTTKRSARQIINQIENVGGEINAFTSKEETVVYAAVPKQFLVSTISLIADIVQNSTFPADEFIKEKKVIIDEIESYNDNPSELIFDDFENILYQNQPLGHFILGTKRSISRFTPKDVQKFHKRNYTAERIVFFATGDVEMDKVIRSVESNFILLPSECPKNQLFTNANYGNSPNNIVLNKHTHQTHIAIGTLCFNLFYSERMAMYLLNNLLGGPSMGSRLNLSLREKYGLVYSVESVFQPFTDNGLWLVYYACAKHDATFCSDLIYSELKKLKQKAISDLALKNYKKQLAGQMTISSENRENMAISLGKSYLRYGQVDSLDDIRKKIDSITAEKLLEIANLVFCEDNFLVLQYE